MSLEKTELKENPTWAIETKRRRFYHQYKTLEKVEFLKNYFLGPSKNMYKLNDFLPKNIVLNEIKPRVKIGFIGDIMKMGKRELLFGTSISNFFKGIDFLAGNFEGIITNRKREVIAEQVHNERILQTLKLLHPPERTYLNYSNNHSNDFGWKEFRNSYQTVKDFGFNVIGKRDEPNILINDIINLASASSWSNQPCKFISCFEEISKYYNSDALFNIFYPHWGYELQLYPHPNQIKFAGKLLTKWDAIIGHHSHNPQPINQYKYEDNNKLIAYSLGNFCYGVIWKIYHRAGMIIKIEIGPNKKGVWQTGKIEWEFILLQFLKEKKVLVDLNKNCRWFKNLN